MVLVRSVGMFLPPLFFFFALVFPKAEQIINRKQLIVKSIIAALIMIIGIILADVISSVAKNIFVVLGKDWKESRVVGSLAGLLIKVLVLLVAITLSFDLLGIYVEIFTISFAIIFFSMVLLIVVGARDVLLNLFAGLYLQSLEKLHKGV